MKIIQLKSSNRKSPHLFIFLILLCLLHISCGKKPEDGFTKVHIVFPKVPGQGSFFTEATDITIDPMVFTQQFSLSPLSALQGVLDPNRNLSNKTGNWGARNPTNFSEILCYILLMSGPEQELRRSNCTMKNGHPGFVVGFFSGGHLPGQQITITVPSGDSREFSLIGFGATSSTFCQDFKTSVLNERELSAPFLLGRSVANLPPGTNQTLTLNASFDSTKQIDNCLGPDFGDQYNQTARPPSNLQFGDGSDGSFTISGSHVLLTATGAKGVPLLSNSYLTSMTVPDPNKPNEVLVTLPENWDTKLTLFDRVQLYVAASFKGATYSLMSTDSVGTSSNLKAVSIAPGPMVTVPATPSKFVFAASSTAEGTEIWVSDGTTAGTQLLKDIRTGTASSGPKGFASALGKVFFWADNSTNGRELWMTDGTTAGTVMVGDINTGAASSYPAFNSKIVEFASKAYFYANGANGIEIYSTTGAEGNFTLLKDANTSGTEGVPEEYNWIGTDGVKLYFANRSSTAPILLWKSDGSTVNTISVDNTSYANPKNFVSDTSGNKMYFMGLATSGFGVEAHYMYNGSSTPIMLGNLNGTNDGEFHRPHLATSSLLYYFSNDGTYGLELWKYQSGTQSLVKDIETGTTGSNDPEPMVFRTSDNILFFTANTSGNGVELWKSDGSSSGTVMVKDIVTGTGSSSPKYLTVFNNLVYFWANDGTAYQMWRTDGTEANTVKLTNFTNTFESGGELPLLVNSSKLFSSMNIQDSAEPCGSFVKTGQRIEGLVMQRHSGTQWLINVGDPLIATVPVANLARNPTGGLDQLGSFTAPSSFCRLVISRIPQFRNLTLNNGADLQAGFLYDLELSPGNYQGGILSIKVLENLTVNPGSSKINMNGSGFKGGAIGANYHGHGTEGIWPHHSKRIGNAGGSNGVCGGGGGHGGAGAGTYGGAAVGDSQINCNQGDSFNRCLFGRIFMGGGGGSTSNMPGGAGGGIIQIEARSLLVPAGANLNIEAVGENGSTPGPVSQGSGGGAGGTVFMKFEEVINNGTVNIYARGGLPGGSTCGSGGGGGGKIHLDVFFKHDGNPFTVNVAKGEASAGQGTCISTGVGSITCP